MTEKRKWKMCVFFAPPTHANGKWRMNLCVQNQNDVNNIVSIDNFRRTHGKLDKARARIRRTQLCRMINEICFNEPALWNDDNDTGDVTTREVSLILA